MLKKSISVVFIIAAVSNGVSLRMLIKKVSRVDKNFIDKLYR